MMVDEQAGRIYFGTGRSAESGDFVLVVQVASNMEDAAEAMQYVDGFILEAIHPRHFDIRTGATFRIHGVKSRDLVPTPNK